MAEISSDTRPSTLKKVLLLLGPGIFLVGYNIGTGSVTTMASAGAEFGMALTWAVLLSCLFTFVLIMAFGRYTAVTGTTALRGFREQFGRPAALFVLLSVLASEFVSSMGVMAVVTQSVQEWSRPLTADGEGLSTVWLAAIFIVVLYGIFLRGTYRFFEKVLALFVGLMGLSMVATMFMVIPHPEEVIAGLVPRIPEGTNAALLTAGMVGTTMGGVLYLMRSILVHEKGWGVNDLVAERRDAAVSALLMFVLSIAVMACAAGTLYPRGLRIVNAIDMVRLLEPLAGRFAISIFVSGIVAAGLSSLFPIALLAPWLIADYRGVERNLKSTGSRAMVGLVMLLGLTVPVFGGRPVAVMILSQAFITLATPLIILFGLLLLNRTSLMGAHKAGRLLNAALVIILLFSLVMAWVGAVGIWEELV